MWEIKMIFLVFFINYEKLNLFYYNNKIQNKYEIIICKKYRKSSVK